MHSIHDVVALVIDRHGPVDVAKLHPMLFYANAQSLLETGALMFPDVALAMPSGPVFPALDVTLGFARWRRRFEARHGTKGRRGARRIPAIETIAKEAA